MATSLVAPMAVAAVVVVISTALAVAAVALRAIVLERGLAPGRRVVADAMSPVIFRWRDKPWNPGNGAKRNGAAA